MAQISINNLTFCYEGSFDNIFENISLSIDTNWKLGFIGRNGKGKTTFLNLLLGKYEYKGSISTSTYFDYFPYRISRKQMSRPAAEFMEELKKGCEQWRVLCELEQLKVDAEVLYRPFETLSSGERTKIMLAVLFSGENDFLLIDEPTNHLDKESRELVKKYLASKKGFILVSHDRDLLDACINHVLVLNRKTIEVQSGNFSSWWENKVRKDKFSIAENEKHIKEITKLKEAASQTAKWADKNERTKIGFNPYKEPDRCIGTRSYIGAKTKKMQSRVRQLENRIEKSIKEKEGLLKDIENPVDLKVMPLSHHKNTLIYVRDYGLQYFEDSIRAGNTMADAGNTMADAGNTMADAGNIMADAGNAVTDANNTITGAGKVLISGLTFEVRQGDRIALSGRNGCGKSSLIKMILQKAGYEGENLQVRETGSLETASGLIISYVNQDTSALKGSIKGFCEERGLDMSLFCAILRQLDMDRVQFEKDISNYSEGQKKKVLVAASLMKSAHLYIWDEPLNYIDIFSRMQIEKLILDYKPTMLFVEHDVYFREKIATGMIEL